MHSAGSMTRDDEILCKAVSPWLAEAVPGARDLWVDGRSVPKAGGFSNGTVLFTAHWTNDAGPDSRRMVLRTPPEGPTFLHYLTLNLQADVMIGLRETMSVPVPNVVWVEHDTSYIGSPYFLMEHVANSRPGPDSPPYTQSGWIIELSPAERRRLHEAAIEAIAALHALDTTTLGMPALARPSETRSALDLRLDFCQSYYEYAARELGAANPHVERGLAWLERNRPTAPADPVLTWGDSRIGNLLFRADGVEITALLDWEFACLASPSHDIAHWLYAQRYFTEGIGTSLPEGFPDREETIAYYQKLTGRTLEDLPYYDVMLALLGAVNMMRVASVSVAAGWLSPDSDMAINNGGTHILRRLMGDVVTQAQASAFLKG
jgi:aminoglycoside phosphotransferase (APT) family kinase protein